MAESTMRKHMDERFGKVSNFTNNPPLPRSLNIELNNSCNHECIFCPFHGKYAPQKPKSALMKKEVAKEILEQAKTNGIGEKEVGFYLAGEAFLYNDLAEVISYAKELGFQYTFITTNGALATPQKMKAVLDAGLDSIRFSINAADKEAYKEIHGKDDFQTVLSNIKYMNKYIKEKNLKIATSLSCVITKKTLDIQEKVRSLFGEYVDDIIFIPVMLTRLKCDEKFIEEYQVVDDSCATINREFICPMLFDTMYINANMEVVPCCEAYDTDCIFYDLKKDFSLANAWNSSRYQQYRNIFLNHEEGIGTICEKCTLRMKGVQRLTMN